MSNRLWAIGAIRRGPIDLDVVGLSCDQAQKRITEMRKAMMETGRTINGQRHIAMLELVLAGTHLRPSDVFGNDDEPTE